jgi:hypothetical protein
MAINHGEPSDRVGCGVPSRARFYSVGLRRMAQRRVRSTSSVPARALPPSGRRIVALLERDPWRASWIRGGASRGETHRPRRGQAAQQRACTSGSQSIGRGICGRETPDSSLGTSSRRSAFLIRRAAAWSIHFSQPMRGAARPHENAKRLRAPFLKIEGRRNRLI